MVSKKTFVKTILLISSLFFIVSCSNFLNEQSGITGSAGNGSTPQEDPTLAFYLDPIHGIDTNEGTEAAPVKTIEKALTLYSNSSFPTIIWIMNTIDVYSGDSIFKGSVDGKSLTLKRYLAHKSALINVEVGGILTLENITIDGNKENVEANEALITVEDEKLILNTNTILQNNNNTINSGGAVNVSHTGTVTIKGGTITNNIATSGGGIHVAIGGTVNLERGGIINISSNKKTDGKLNNIAYTNSSDASPISVSSDITSEIKIGLSPLSTDYRDMLVIADSGITIIASHFTRDSGGGVATFNNNLIVSPIEVYLDPGSGADDNNGETGNPVKTMTRAIALLGDVGIISDANTIWVMSTITVSTDIKWNYNSLTLKRNNPFTGLLISVESDATLTLENIIIDGNKNIVTGAIETLIKVGNASLVLNAGAILQNNTSTNSDMAVSGDASIGTTGGGLYVAGGGRVTINGGEIIKNESESIHLSSGGGLYVAGGGTVIINSGIITGNYSNATSGGSAGGGLYVNKDGAVTINGGTITGNESVAAASKTVGGGLYVHSNGTVTINGGTITGNSGTGTGTGTNIGGGLYVAEGGRVDLGKGFVINITNNVLEPLSPALPTPSNISFPNTKTTTPIKIINDIVNGTKIGLSPSKKDSGDKLVNGEANQAAIYEASYFELDGINNLNPVKDQYNNLIIGSP